MGTPPLVEELKKKPYLVVDFPLPRAQIEEAVATFLKVTELPDEVKYHIDTRLPVRHRRGDLGLKHRDPNEGIYNDRKDFFHYHPLIWTQYEAFIESQPVVRDFLNQAHTIWETIYEMTQQIMVQLDQAFPGTMDKIFAVEHPHILLRFLRYDWVDASSEYLAKPHFDAGAFTFAIAESCQGLRIGTGPDDLELIDQHENQALFMVASNAKKTIGTDDLAPGWHDVIQLDETQIGKPFSRWAVVAFIEAWDVEALDRSETHKWATPQPAF